LNFVHDCADRQIIAFRWILETSGVVMTTDRQAEANRQSALQSAELTAVACRLGGEESHYVGG